MYGFLFRNSKKACLSLLLLLLPQKGYFILRHHRSPSAASDGSLLNVGFFLHPLSSSVHFSMYPQILLLLDRVIVVNFNHLTP